MTAGNSKLDTQTGPPLQKPIMDENSTGHDGVSTAMEFKESINQLLRAAYENDVNVEKSLEIRNGQEVPDWEVLIHKLAKPDGD